MPEAATKKENKTVKILKLLLKIAVTILCFWYISRKIDFSKAGDAIQQADALWLILSVLLLAFSKFLSSFRLNIYFRNIGLHLTQKQNLRLYWLGMFYNLFLPGAIGGDAYKVIILAKRYNGSYRKITAAVLLDRFSGLLALGLILSVYGIIVLDNLLYELILAGGSVLAAAALYFIIYRYLRDFLAGFWTTLFWGIAVQLCQVVCIYCILAGLHLPLQAEWIFIFLASAVITVIPISLGGGLGTRELVFVEGARYFGLDMHIAPIVSILFYLSSAIPSAWGAYFIYHDPLKENGE